MKSYLGLKKARVRDVDRLWVLACGVLAVHSFFFWMGFVASRSDLSAKLICSGSEKVGYVFLAISLAQAFSRLPNLLYRHMPAP